MNIDGHDCFLGDDGTLDTVIEVDGKEFRFGDTSWARDPDMCGYMMISLPYLVDPFQLPCLDGPY